jgi:hypothetical protein
MMPEENVDTWKCDATHQLMTETIDFFNNASTAAIAGTLSLPLIATLLAAATIITAGTVWILGFLAVLAGTVTVIPLDWIRDWLSEKRDDLICVIYGSVSPSEAYANVLAFLDQHKADVNGTVAGFWVQNALKPFLSGVNWNAIFEPDSIEISAQNLGSSCPCEGVLLFDIFGDQTWYLVPAIEGEEFVNNDATYEVGNFLWSFIGTGTNQHAQSYPDFPEFLASGKTWLGGGGGQVAETGEHAGYVMQRVGGDTNVQTFDISGASIIGVDGTNFPLSDVWTEWNANSDLPKVDFQSGLEAIFDGLDISHEADQTFTNLDQHRMTMRGLDEDPRTVQFRVYAVIAATALNLT